MRESAALPMSGADESMPRTIEGERERLGPTRKKTGPLAASAHEAECWVDLQAFWAAGRLCGAVLEVAFMETWRQNPKSKTKTRDDRLVIYLLVSHLK